MFPHVREASPGKNAAFPPIYLSHIHRRLPDSLGFQFVTQPYPTCICLMWFLFVRPGVCRRLPSDSLSPWTPLPLAMCLAPSTRTRDFHPLDCAHAGRTLTKPCLMIQARLLLYTICGNMLIMSIPLARSRFLSSRALFPRSSRTFATRFTQTSKSSKIHFGNFAESLAKVSTSLTWIAQHQHILSIPSAIYIF